MSIKSRKAPSCDGAFPLWMWGVKEKDMAIYKLLSEIIPLGLKCLWIPPALIYV
jgi:hypothetical protein